MTNKFKSKGDMMETKKIKDQLKEAIEPKIQQALRARDSAAKRVQGYAKAQDEAEKQITNRKSS